MITTVVFDLGGVLVENPALPLKLFCAKKLGVNSDKLGPLLDKYISEFQIGYISEQKFWEHITSDLNISLPKEESLWKEAIKSAFIINREMEKLLIKLKKNKYQIVLLSNTELPVLKVIEESRINEFFDLRFFSCVEKVAKPDVEIYNRLMKSINSKPEELIFIDDREENIITANKIGINGIHFKNYSLLIRKLQKYKLRF